MVEDINKRREPLPQLVGIYFISPTDAAVRQVVRDFSLASMPQYKAVHVFFSSRPSSQQLAAIRECQQLVSRLRTLKEVRAGAGCGMRWQGNSSGASVGEPIVRSWASDCWYCWVRCIIGVDSQALGCCRHRCCLLPLWRIHAIQPSCVVPPAPVPR